MPPLPGRSGGSEAREVTGEPANLSSLLRWYRDEVDGDIPARIHSRQLDAGGAPAWHAAFVRWLTAHPCAEDKEGYLLSPLRYWLSRYSRRRSRYCFVLASCAFDWHFACRVQGVYDQDAAHDYTRETLLRLWRLMYHVAPDASGRLHVSLNEPRREIRGKSESQLDAEAA
jgi:hypothetical protein